MKRALTGSVALALLVAAVPAAAEPLAVDDASLPALVASRNGEVASARLRAEAAERQTGHLRRSLLPSLRAAGGSETFETGTLDRKTQPFGEVEASLSLFNGGRDRRQDRIFGLERDIARAELDAVARERTREARALLADARFWAALARTLSDAAGRNDLFVRAADRRIRGGLSTATDRDEVELNGVQLRQDLARAEMQRTEAELRLAALLGAESVAVTSGSVHVCGTDASNDAFDASEHPSVRQAELTAEREGRLAGQARGFWLPSADLYGGYALYTAREREYERRQDRDDTFAGARVSMLLFDGRREAALATSASLRSEAAKREVDQRRRAVQTEHERLRREVAALDRALHAAESSLSQSDRYLKNVANEYERGVKNLPDLLAALSRAVEVRRRHLEAERDHAAAAAALASLNWH